MKTTRFLHFYRDKCRVKSRGGNEKQKTSHNIDKDKVGQSNEGTTRRDEKKPCVVYHDARDMDGVDGVTMDKLFTQNHPRTLSGRANGFAWRAGRGENSFDL